MYFLFEMVAEFVVCTLLKPEGNYFILGKVPKVAHRDCQNVRLHLKLTIIFLYIR